MAKVVLVDGRNIFRPEAALAAGFDYTGLGRIIRGIRQETTPAAVRKIAFSVRVALFH